MPFTYDRRVLLSSHNPYAKGDYPPYSESFDGFTRGQPMIPWSPNLPGVLDG